MIAGRVTVQGSRSNTGGAGSQTDCTVDVKVTSATLFVEQKENIVRQITLSHFASTGDWKNGMADGSDRTQ